MRELIAMIIATSIPGMLILAFAFWLFRAHRSNGRSTRALGAVSGQGDMPATRGDVGAIREQIGPVSATATGLPWVSVMFEEGI